MPNYFLRTVLFSGVMFGAGLLPASAETFTQEQLFDRIVAEDQVLNELADQLDMPSSGSALLRSFRNPQLRASYGQADDESFDDGLRVNEDRETYDIDLRFYIPNPYDVVAAKAEAESGQYRVQATAQQYLATKFTRARELWADLRYTTHMVKELEALTPFWESTSDLLNDAGGAAQTLGPDLLAWQMDYFYFLELKSEVTSTYWRALQELARFANVSPIKLEPKFAALTGGDEEGSVFSDIESASLLDQRERVAREKSRLAELQAENIPWIDFVQGSYGELSSDVEREGWSVRVAVSLPVFSLASGKSGEQRALLRAEEATLKLLEQGEDQAQQQLAKDLKAKKSRIDLYEAEIMPQIESMRKLIVDGGVGAGGAMNVQINLADTFIKSVESFYRTQREYEQDLIELDALRGRLP